MEIDDQMQSMHGKHKLSWLQYFSFTDTIQLLAKLSLLVSLGISFVLLYDYKSAFPRDLTFFVLFSSLSCLILLLLSILYFLASKLYRDTFYFLLCIAWLAVAIQVF